MGDEGQVLLLVSDRAVASWHSTVWHQHSSLTRSALQLYSGSISAWLHYGKVAYCSPGSKTLSVRIVLYFSVHFTLSLLIDLFLIY